MSTQSTEITDEDDDGTLGGGFAEVRDGETIPPVVRPQVEDA